MMKNLILTAGLITMTVALPGLSLAAQTDQDMVNGTANIVDYESGTVIVHDNASGTDRTFTADSKDELKNIKSGDTVSVTPDNGDTTHASKIVKK